MADNKNFKDIYVESNFTLIESYTSNFQKEVTEIIEKNYHKSASHHKQVSEALKIIEKQFIKTHIVSSI